MATTTTKKADTLATAFLKAQSEFPTISKDSEANAGAYKYRYASLPAILGIVLPVLHKHGLYLTQRFEESSLVTEICGHGESVRSVLSMPSPVGIDPQMFGKITTYLRRYSLIALLGVAPDDDDDCIGIGAPPAQPPLAAPQPPADDAPPLTEDDDATDKYLAAVGDLVDRGVVALTKIGNWDDPADEMRERMERVLKQFDVALPVSIDSRADRLKFYHLFEATVKAIEADAEAVEEVGL